VLISIAIYSFDDSSGVAAEKKVKVEERG